MNGIDVQCAATADGWRCTVTITDRHGSSVHEVTVASADAEHLAAARELPDVERLVYETAAFLLERESRESILRSFDITVVGRYFPEFDAEIRSRLAP